MPETEFYSLEVPASNAYKPADGISSRKKRTFNAHLNRDKSPKDCLKPLKRDDSPSPAHYEAADRSWKKMSVHPVKNYAYSISKEPKKSFIDVEVKNKNFVPGSGKYKDEMAQFSKLARGSSIPRFRRGV